MARPGVPACSASERAFPGRGERQCRAGAGAARRHGGSSGSRGRYVLCRPCLCTPGPTDIAARGAEHSVTATFPPSSWLTQPLNCKTPPAAHAGVQSLGAKGIWLAPLAQVEVKAEHRAASLSRSCGFFFHPRTKSIPRPIFTHGWGLWVGWAAPTTGSGEKMSRDGAERGYHPSSAAAMLSPTQDQPRRG